MDVNVGQTSERAKEGKVRFAMEERLIWCDIGESGRRSGVHDADV